MLKYRRTPKYHLVQFFQYTTRIEEDKEKEKGEGKGKITSCLSGVFY
jgi:hypothetical protein